MRPLKASLIGMIVIGVIVLAAGAFLIVRGTGVKSTVMKAVKDEQVAPMSIISDKLTPGTGIIDTPKEITDTADAIRDARWAISKPADSTNQAQSNLMVVETVLRSSAAGLSTGLLMEILGIIALLVGVALIAGGFAITGIARMMAAAGEAAAATANAPAPEPASARA
jgi:hypothetical protein